MTEVDEFETLTCNELVTLSHLAEPLVVRLLLAAVTLADADVAVDTLLVVVTDARGVEELVMLRVATERLGEM